MFNNNQSTDTKKSKTGKLLFFKNINPVDCRNIQKEEEKKYGNH